MNEIFGALLLRPRWSDRDKLGVYTHVFRDGRHDGAIAGRIPASGMGAGTVRSALDDFDGVAHQRGASSRRVSWSERWLHGVGCWLIGFNIAGQRFSGRQRPILGFRASTLTRRSGVGPCSKVGEWHPGGCVSIVRARRCFQNLPATFVGRDIHSSPLFPLLSLHLIDRAVLNSAIMNTAISGLRHFPRARRACWLRKNFSSTGQS